MEARETENNSLGDFPITEIIIPIDNHDVGFDRVQRASEAFKTGDTNPEHVKALGKITLAFFEDGFKMSISHSLRRFSHYGADVGGVEYA